MKNIFRKLVQTVLLTLLGVAVTAITYHFSADRSELLSASLLDGKTPADVVEIEFVSPKGTAYPSNGVVKILSVYVDAGGSDQGNLSGADLENSFITFQNGSTPCPAGTVFSGNEIILPDNFNTFCTVDAVDPDGTESQVELRIEPVSCANLQTSIIRGYGSGFENITPADLGEFADTQNGFGGFDFDSGTPITSINLSYPTAIDSGGDPIQGVQTFEIALEFLPDIAVDPINGVTGRAEITANNGVGNYEIKVRDEGEGNETATALNFAYVFNDLLGTDSPLLAYLDPVDPAIIQLEARELGDHPNDNYICHINGVQQGPPCFGGGVDGQNEGEDVLTIPLTLDKEMLQGDTALVFAAQSAGEIEWISSHPSVLEVTSLSEASQAGDSTVDFLEALLDVTADNPDESKGAYSLTGSCEEEFDDDQPPNLVSQSCEIEITIPVSYDISSENYEANVSIEGDVVNVPLTGSELVGSITATGTYVMGVGGSWSFSGNVQGPVSGVVAGQYSGTVNGQITAEVTANETIADQGELTDLVTQIEGNINLVGADLSAGILKEVPDSFTSTVKKEEQDISHLALLFAKRPGTSILTAIDKQGCIASFDLQVIKKQVVLQMVGRDPGDVLDVSDTVQINAFVGGANQEFDEYQNITAASGIEWFSSNEEVATIDQTGLLTALKPGVTNITAQYDTGEAEIGTIESIPLQVTVNKITDLRVTFDQPTQDKLPDTLVKAAHESVIIAIHNSEAAGQTLIVEGQQVPIILPDGTYSNEISKVDAIVNDPVDGLAAQIAALTNSVPDPIVEVTSVDGFPGMLILQPINQDSDTDGDKIEDIDENGVIDIDTTALETDMAILPTFDNAIPLPASETYGLQVIAKYDNGATKLLPPTQFKWINTPLNYLQQAALDTGFIKLGEIPGTSTVVAEYENADGSVVQSNYLTIEVESGPVIEFLRRIGSGSVTKGARILLQTKITDVDTISDIAYISTSLVFSNFNTYQKINEDPSAIWFSATPFLEEVTVVDEGEVAPPPPAEGEEGQTTETTQEQTTTTQTLQYKTYNIPVEIPVDENLFDGVYKLIISISDTANHTLNYVYPIRIGEIGEGDVNGDGVTNMVDVIIAFQIASGILPNPTPAQLEAANVDGVGGVTLVDVILLFNKVSNQ